MARTKQSTKKATGGKAPRKQLSAKSGMKTAVGAPGAGSKKQRYKPGSVALREIRRYQRSTELLIRKLPFQRLVREIFSEVGAPSDIRIQAPALAALQESTEAIITRMLEGAYLCSSHVNRVTLLRKDIDLWHKITGPYRESGSGAEKL